MGRHKSEDNANRKPSRPRNRDRERSRAREGQRRNSSRHAHSYSRSPSGRPRANAYRPTDSLHHLRDTLMQQRHSGPIDITLPKNFEKPLTCFFWHANGRCNKRDEDCIYAHWETGFFAVAPTHGNDSVTNTTDRTAGQHLQNYTSSASKSTVNNLGDREESLKLKEEELNNKLKTIARKKEDIERLVRLRDKEFKTREKRIERNEEALKKAESVLRMCERCRGEKYRLDNGTEKSAASPLLDEDHNGHFLTSYSHLD